MNYSRLAVILASLVAALSFSAQAETNLVTDGNFALDPRGQVSNYWSVQFKNRHGWFNWNPYGMNEFVPLPTPNGTTTYWESQQTSGGWPSSTYYPGKLSQTITGLEIGHEYSLSFYTSATDWVRTDESAYYAVDFLGSVQNGSTHYSTMGKPGYVQNGREPWILSTMTFTAQSESSVLSFFQVNVTPASSPTIMYLSDIKLTEVAAAVPEPSAFVLASLGLVAFGFTARRKKAAQAV